MDNNTQILSFDPCSYAFLGEHQRFTFRGASDFTDPNFTQRVFDTVPVVVDWVLGNQSCAVAKKEDDYACGGNSSCVDSDNGHGGYRCSCNKGYEGNPYLNPGCQGLLIYHSRSFNTSFNKLYGYISFLILHYKN